MAWIGLILANRSEQCMSFSSYQSCVDYWQIVDVLKQKLGTESNKIILTAMPLSISIINAALSTTILLYYVKNWIKKRFSLTRRHCWLLRPSLDACIYNNLDIEEMIVNWIPFLITTGSMHMSSQSVLSVGTRPYTASEFVPDNFSQ